MSVFSKEADMTYMAWGGIAIAIIVIVGLMYLHNSDTEKDLLSPEHIMALIGVPLTILSYVAGKKHGESTSNNGNGNGRKPPEE